LKKFKHIVVNEANYNTLSQLGKAGQSFNDVLTELLKEEKIKVQTGLPVGEQVAQSVFDLRTASEGDSDHE
jgi:predicted CopG family antitoxin